MSRIEVNVGSIIIQKDEIHVYLNPEDRYMNAMSLNFWDIPEVVITDSRLEFTGKEVKCTYVHHDFRDRDFESLAEIEALGLNIRKEFIYRKMMKVPFGMFFSWLSSPFRATKRYWTVKHRNYAYKEQDNPVKDYSYRLEGRDIIFHKNEKVQSS